MKLQSMQSGRRMPLRWFVLTELMRLVSRFLRVLLDHQANISIVRPELLRQVQPLNEVVRVNGVGGMQLELQETGYLDNFFQVYTSTETRANVLSFSDVEVLYPITHEPFVGFTVHTPEGEIYCFRRRGCYMLPTLLCAGVMCWLHRYILL
jgi:hypothetical protein